jgi:hypothetical protein
VQTPTQPEHICTHKILFMWSWEQEKLTDGIYYIYTFIKTHGIKLSSMYFIIRKFYPVILATWEAENRRIMVQGQPGQTVWETPISKNNQSKMDCNVTRAVESLSCKDKDLNSNSSPTKNKKLARHFGPFLQSQLLYSVSCLNAGVWA